MARINKLFISGYRSIQEEIEIAFPASMPTVLVGENNAGKSNIVRALDLILGEMWPGSREPDDHDFWNRDSQNGSIEIRAYMSDLTLQDWRGEHDVNSIMWIYNPNAEGEKLTFRADTSDGEKYVSKVVRDNCICVVIGADRKLSYQLSYSSKYTLLSKIMRKFHNSLVENPNRVERLKERFEEIVNIFQEVEQFSNFQTNLKEDFATILTGMTYGLGVDFSAYDPSNFFHSLRLFPQEDGNTRTFEELGTGQEQVLALAVAHAYARAFYGGIILVIEEPEAHLHPLAQDWLARKIKTMANDGLQILLTTHSTAFVDILGLSGLVLVRKVNNSTIVKQLNAQSLSEFCVNHGSPRERTNSATILPFYASSATIEIITGLFAKAVILVEGPTEALSLPIYLSKVDLDVSKEGVAIISVMGKGNLAKWWRFFKAYEIPVYLTFDNDTRNDENGNRRIDALRTIGIEDNEIESIIEIEDWSVQDEFCVFGNDFETTFRGLFEDYNALEDEARSQIGDSKPLVARYVAHRLEVNDSDGWNSMQDFKAKILSLLYPEVEDGENTQELNDDEFDDVPF